MNKNYFFIVFTFFLASAYTSQAFAALGGGSDSISSDHKALRATSRETFARTGYSVAELTSHTTTVREFVSPSGIVFGISWNGNVHPDLTQFLGNYSGEYAEAHSRTVKNSGKRRMKITTKNIVVEKWGHMRNLSGRAYVPVLIPAGVTVDEIK